MRSTKRRARLTRRRAPTRRWTPRPPSGASSGALTSSLTLAASARWPSTTRRLLSSTMPKRTSRAPSSTSSSPPTFTAGRTRRPRPTRPCSKWRPSLHSSAITHVQCRSMRTWPQPHSRAICSSGPSRTTSSGPCSASSRPQMRTPQIRRGANWKSTRAWTPPLQTRGKRSSSKTSSRNSTLSTWRASRRWCMNTTRFQSWMPGKPRCSSR
mmetsp:Transcript_15914/g.42841  ORF Transcript_15914/g.42841 Transcript_15914/m.42841 type:complete len:211 (-) Transcript_15914:499-1131(-)